MVADAVAIEPVSASEFPDNREFRWLAENLAIWCTQIRAASGRYQQIPYATEQGIFRCDQGALAIGNLRHFDVFRGRLQYPDLRRKVANLAAVHEANTVLIENAGSGMALLQDLWRDLPRGMSRPIGRKPEGSKVDRMVAQSAKVEAGHVHLFREAYWLDMFLHELLAFPNGRHDD